MKRHEKDVDALKMSFELLSKRWVIRRFFDVLKIYWRLLCAKWHRDMIVFGTVMSTKIMYLLDRLGCPKDVFRTSMFDKLIIC